MTRFLSLLLFCIFLLITTLGCGGGEGKGLNNNPDRPRASDDREQKW